MVTGLGVTSDEHRLALGRKYRGDHGVGDIAHKRELGPSRSDRSAQGVGDTLPKHELSQAGHTFVTRGWDILPIALNWWLV